MRGIAPKPWSSYWSFVHGRPVHARGRPRPGAPSVVLVHGLLVSSRYMEPTARHLQGEVDLWAPDMPGFGRSQGPARALDVPGLGDSLRAWMKSRGLGGVVMLANSFGCQYAVDLLARDPHAARALVLAGPTMDPEERTALRQAARWTANGPKEPPSLAGVIARDLVDCGLRRVALTYRHGLHDAIEEKLPRVRIPTVVMRGERDPLVTERWAEQATALLPDGRLVVVPGAGHTLNYNAPEVTANVVRTLL